MAHSPVRWGILSTAKIGVEKVIPALFKAQAAGAPLEVRAIASRTAESARAAADKLGIPIAHGSYAALIADPEIDVIYNPLPNHLHVPLTLAAAQAGKHVLCEKPFSIKAAELDALRPWASKVHIEEAFMVRHHPLWQAVRKAVREGAIGTLRQAQAPFGYFNDDPANIRNQPDIGGGALYDIGCYAIAAGRWFFEAEPTRVIASIDRDPVLRTDRSASGLIDFPGGRQMVFTVSTQVKPVQRLRLIGTAGNIDVEIPFNLPIDGPARWHLNTTGQNDGQGVQTFTVPPCDMYALQGAAFTRQVLEDTPTAAGLDQARAQMRVLDAIFRSETSGRWELPD
jgi:predicted dehydrogenase